MRTGCSTPSSPPKPTAWVWGSRSAVRSSKPTVAGCGPQQTYPTVQHFSSPCRLAQTLRRETASAVQRTEGSPEHDAECIGRLRVDGRPDAIRLDVSVGS